MRKILTSGLGGGLDIINASIINYALESEGDHAFLGSIKSAPVESINGNVIKHKNWAEINPQSEVQQLGRYVEPQVSSFLGKNVLLFSQSNGPEGLSLALTEARTTQDISHMLFIDGGGDSLIIKSSDASHDSETTDPFKGGDATSLAAIRNISNVYLGIISVGLDIRKEAFDENIERLKKMDGYYGRVNLATGEKKDYRLEHILGFNRNFLPKYFALAENILVLGEEDLAPRGFTKNGKTLSHTAVVTYHALKGNFGHQRTYVPWEPTTTAGDKGVIVTPEHQWMYFVAPDKVEQLKRELN